MDDAMVQAYLDRIGAARPAGPDLDGLRHLQERHVMSVPFENLDYHLDEPVHLDERLLDKIVLRRRGGGCYETNPALGMLLAALGYDVTILPGRVYRADRLGPPMCHLALRVMLDEPWLVDAGFGRNSRLPLRLDSRTPQPDPNGVYELTPVDGGGIDLRLNGRLQYRLDDRPCRLDDFRPTLWWYRFCPDSPFLQDVFCSLPTPTGRITLKGDQLTIADGDERRTETLPDDAAVFDAYAKYFGVDLDRLPGSPQIPETGTIGIQLD